MMTPEQKAAYVNAQVALALIELESMKADNALRESQGLSPSYGQYEFLQLQEKYPIGHNAILKIFED